MTNCGIEFNAPLLGIHSLFEFVGRILDWFNDGKVRQIQRPGKNLEVMFSEETRDISWQNLIWHGFVGR